MSAHSPVHLQSIHALRVLILEDQAFQRQLIVGLLKCCGIVNIVEAVDGNEGLAALNMDHEGFDIAICDLKMDGMDGIEFIRHAARRNVKSFIVTSALESQLLSHAGELGEELGAPILGVLPKPITISELRSMLELHISRTKAFPLEGASTGAAPRQWRTEDLVAALDSDQFVPYFQPKVRFSDFSLEGVEILARWEHDTLGVRPPAEFIESMEQEGLIDRLTENIFRKSLACAHSWQSRHAHINMAINVSRLTLQKIDTVNHVALLTKEAGIPPERVTIEVTETAVSKNATGLLETLTRLRMHGFNISIDDFGTGYSSLLQLNELPFNEIKIDRTFVHGVRMNHKASIILESIINLARRLGIRTIAEGIETHEEMVFIRGLGCEIGQGYFFNAPMSHANFLNFLAARPN